MNARGSGLVELPESIREKLPDIAALARAFGVERLEIFGSVMTDAYSPFSSDIDFLVTYPEGYDHGPFLKRYQDLERELAILLGSPVDLVMTNAPLSSGFRDEASNTRRMIYDATANS